MRNRNKNISDNAQANHLLWIGRAIYQLNNLFIMFKRNLNLRSAVLTAAIVLLTTASAHAQLYWSGMQTLQPGQVINDNIILTGNTEITIASGTANINGSISEQGGARSITKTGGGEVRFNSPTNSYSGATTISAGSITLGSGTTLANLTHTSGVSVSSGASLQFWVSGTITFSRVISGAGAVRHWGNGKVILTATNTYTGQTVINSNGGILQVGNGTSGSIANTSNVYFDNAGAVLRFEPGGSMTFSKVISGAGRTEFKCDVAFNLTGNNTYTGTTTIEQGYVYIGSGGTTGSIAGNIITNGTIGFTRSDAYTYSGVISGTGGVYKGSTGTLTLTGVNTYSGETYIVSGTLLLGASGGITKSDIVRLDSNTAKFSIASGSPKTIQCLYGFYADAEVILGSTLYIGTSSSSSDGDGYFTGKITGGGSLIKRGTGILTLTGANTYTGGTQISSGTLEISTLNNIGTQHLNIAGGTLQWASGSSVDISPRLGWVRGNVTFDTNGNTVMLAATLDPQGGTLSSVTKAGGGTLTFSTNQTYGGATVVTGGRLRFQGSLASSGISIGSSGANVTFARSGSGNTTYSGVISGAGSVTQNASSSSSVLILTGNNTYAGGTSVTGGHLYVGNGGTTGDVWGDISLSSGRTVRFYRSNDFLYSGVISGPGNVEKWGSGNTILIGENTYTGSTTINDGTLQIGNTVRGSIHGTSNVILSGGILRFEPGENMFFNKVISGTSGSVQYRGLNDRQLYLTADNTYTGTTTIEEGILNIGNNSTAGDILGNIINNGRLTFMRSNDYTYSGIISGTGQVWQVGTGALTLNTAHTYTGRTYIYAGSVILGTNGSITNSSEVFFEATNPNLKLSIMGSKTIKALNSVEANCEVDLGTNTLTIGTAGEADGGGNFAGKFTGTTGAVTKTGLNIFALSGLNEVTGMFLHNQGTINLSGLWKGNYNKAAGANLTVIGNPIIEGTFMISGGDINMDLTQTVPSKITVFGNVSASGVNWLNILASEDQANYALIQTAGGLNTTSPFSLNMPDFDASLEATGTALLLTARYTSIKDDKFLSKLGIYPNPTTGKFSVVSSEMSVVRIEILDITGRIVHRVPCTVNRANVEIDISNLPNGVYFVKADNETVRIVKK